MTGIGEVAAGTSTRKVRSLYPDIHRPGRILVVEEKHSIRYFDIADNEKLGQVCLRLLKERMEPGYAYIVKPDEPEYEQELTQEQIDMLPQGSSVQVLAQQHKKQNLRDRRQYEDELLWYETALLAVKEKNGERAWQVIRHRGDYEYEGYRIEYLEQG